METDTGVSKEVKPHNVLYEVDIGYRHNSVENHGFVGAYATISWNSEKKQWFESIVTRHIEPEWGQHEAGQEFETQLEPRALNAYAIKKLLESYNIDLALVETSKVPSMSPPQLEKIANSARN